MAFMIVLETILITMVSSTLSISKLTSTLIVPMTVWHGPCYGCGHSMAVCLTSLAWAALWLRSPMGVCLICLAWAALQLQPPHGRVLSMFGMGRPMVACGSHDRGIPNKKCVLKSTSKSEDEIRNESRAIRPMAPIYIYIYIYTHIRNYVCAITVMCS